MARKSASPLRTATFIESMECLPVPKIPEGPEWTYELLCADQHKISYSQPEPVGSLSTARHSMGSTKPSFDMPAYYKDRGEPCRKTNGLKTPLPASS
jgi:hypothetical protein